MEFEELFLSLIILEPIQCFLLSISSHYLKSRSFQEKMEKHSKVLIEGMELTSEAMYCSSRMMDDGLIDPLDTREILIFTLETCKETEHRGTMANTFGVQRL